MKKIILLLLAISLVATMLAGCGDEPATTEKSENKPVVEKPVTEEEKVETEVAIEDNTVAEDEQEAEEAPEEKVEAEPEKPATAPEKPATTPEKPAPAPEKPATTPEKPATTPEKPATTPVEKPKEEATTPVEKPEAVAYSISEIHTIIKNTYGEDYRPNVEIPKEYLTDLFGINLNDVEEYIAEQPMISANIDTFIAIKAKSGKGETVASALNAYKSSILEGAAMYPSNMPKAQAAKVVRHGDYVFLVMLGAAGDMEADEDTQLAFAKAQVEKGVNAINNYFTK